MHILDDTARLRPFALAFTNCFDASTNGHVVHLTRGEETQLQAILTSLRDCGLILCANLAHAESSSMFEDAIALLQTSVGSSSVSSGRAARYPFVVSSNPPPIALMMVWPFEPEGYSDDVLVTSAQLWGLDLFVEALRVENDENPVPVPSVRERYGRWAAAAAESMRLARATRLPGRQGSYALFAAAAPE